MKSWIRSWIGCRLYRTQNIQKTRKHKKLTQHHSFMYVNIIAASSHLMINVFRSLVIKSFQFILSPPDPRSELSSCKFSYWCAICSLSIFVTSSVLFYPLGINDCICIARSFCPLTSQFRVSGNAIHTISSSSVLETVSIREINLRNFAEAGREPVNDL